MTRLRIALLLLALLAAPAPRATAAPPAVPVADWDMSWNWDWHDFQKFWGKQLGKTTGVVGSVALVVGVGALIVTSSKKKT